MSAPALRDVTRLRRFVQGEDPDPLPATFRTTTDAAVDDLTGYEPDARFQRPNGTTIDATPALDGGTPPTQALVPFPPLDETGTWYLDVWVTKDGTVYYARAYCFDVGDPLIAAPGEPPPPGDSFVTELELQALAGLPGGLFPDGTPNDGDIVVWDEATGHYVTAPAPSGGGGGGTYHHVQSVAAAVWTVNHNLGFKPGGIYVEDSAHNQLAPRVLHVSANTLTLSFFTAGNPTATGGEADLS